MDILFSISPILLLPLVVICINTYKYLTSTKEEYIEYKNNLNKYFTNNKIIFTNNTEHLNDMEELRREHQQTMNRIEHQQTMNRTRYKL